MRQDPNDNTSAIVAATDLLWGVYRDPNDNSTGNAAFSGQQGGWPTASLDGWNTADWKGGSLGGWNGNNNGKDSAFPKLAWEP